MRSARRQVTAGMDVCTYTGKRRFKSKAGVCVAAHHLEKSKAWRTHRARVYPCIHSGGWHLRIQV